MKVAVQLLFNRERLRTALRFSAFLVALWLISYFSTAQWVSGIKYWGFAVQSRDGVLAVRMTAQLDHRSLYSRAEPLANIAELRPFSRDSLIRQVFPRLTIASPAPYQQAVRFRGNPPPVPVSRYQSYELSCPWWLITLFGGLCYFWLFRDRKSCLDADAILCSRCGYDVRASKGQCPECGTVLVQQEE